MNSYFLLKIFISALVIAGVSELAKRDTFVAALFASLPFTSLLALTWLYYDTRDTQKIIELCYSIFWMVIPSLTFFLIFPLLLKQGMRFPWALLLSSGLCALIYSIFIFFIRGVGGST